MPSPARLGVVVLNWNGRALLEDLLPGLLASDHPDFVVVVADNASVDGSVEWLRRRHPSVEVVALAENRRFAGGNNAGARRARELGAEILLLLNNDTLVDPTCLRRLGEAFDDPEVGVVGPRICYADRPCRIWYGGGIFRPALGDLRHRALRRPLDAGADPAGPTDWVTGCALAIRGGLWDSLGGLDEDYYIYAEDVDLCLRAREAGAALRYEPRAVVLHKVSATVGGTASAFKAYHRSRSTWQLVGRHVHGPARLGAALGLGLRDLATVVQMLGKGSPRAAAAVPRAWWDAATGRLSHRAAPGPKTV